MLGLWAWRWTVVDQPEITRQQLERAAALADRDDPYARRWSVLHERIAEAATGRALDVPIGDQR